MRALVVLGAVLAFSIPASALQTVIVGGEDRLTTASATYLLEGVELIARHRRTDRELWRRKVEAPAGALRLVGDVLLYRSCLGGAYLACETRGVDAETGHSLWTINGNFVGVDGRDLLFDVTFPWYAGPQAVLSLNYALVDVQDGERRKFTLEVLPRTKCGDWVGLAAVNDAPKVSGKLLTLRLEDKCGEFARPYRWK